MSFYSSNPTSGGFTGPTTGRKCTDCFCCLLFTLFILFAGAVFVVLFPFSTEKVRDLYIPIDSHSRACGEVAWEYGQESTFPSSSFSSAEATAAAARDLTAYPFLYYKDKDNKICVAECPDSEVAVICSPDWVALTTCTATNPGPCIATHSSLYDSECILGSSLVPTVPLTTWLNLNRCIPDTEILSSDLFNSTMYDEIQSNLSSTAVTELMVTWKFVLAGGLISLFLGFLWLLILKCLANVVVYVTIFGLGATLFAGAGIFGYRYFTAISEATKEAALWPFVGLAAGSVIFLVLICCLWKSIRTAIVIIGVGARAVRSMFHTAFVPLLFVLVGLIGIAFFGIGLLSAVTGGEMTVDKGDREYAYSTLGYVCMGCTGFGIIWFIFFTLGLTEMTLSGAFLEWYATQSNGDVRKGAVTASLGRALRYHTGSIAFGSCIICIVWWLRMIFNFLMARLTKKTNQSKVAKCLACCISCCLKCFEKFLRYMDRLAYIGIAHTGKSFCRGAKDALHLMIENAGDLIAVNAIGDSLLFLGKLVISLGTSILVGLFMINYYPNMSYLVPGIATFILAFIFVHMMLETCELAIDSCYYAYVHERKCAGGNAGYSYKAPQELRAACHRGGGGMSHQTVAVNSYM
eukprot:gnl/Dysnectes_brevis/515_a571_5208.p1 GENE.gnl/Dysnectes_brevis/515_a571_5208~~gnl/Dysnectes_brevis/515_a571_5208.p1  ORF type:complete len:634 (-),score=197.89 gnl/Dysnectes_brevis/515_a571_5208:63-1964(-)